MPELDAHGPNAGGPDVVVPGAPLVPGRVIGSRYELIRPIARGGMAEVWEGRDATLRRAVAVKILQTHLAADVTFLERFRREAVTAARVAHPCVVATYDAGVDGGTAYIVMELVQGQTLRQLLTASAPLDPGLAVAIAVQIADALADAHRAGLVHRDIKPANILLCDDGGGGLRVKVTDFGIAKVGADLGADLTLAGTVLGTPKYLSPEQVEGRDEPDARSDLYSLGVVLFEMLTGRPPFNGHNEMATALSHLREPAPPVSTLRPDVSAGLDAFVARLLAKAPADRPPSAVAARQALDRLVHEGLTARPRPVAPRTRAAGDGPGRPSGEDRPPALSGPVGNEAWRHGSTSPYVRSTLPAPTTATRAGVTRPVGAPRVPVAPRPPPGARSSPRPPTAPAAGSRPARRHRSGRVPGLLVAAIVLVAVIVAAILIADNGGADRPVGGSTAPVAIGGVSVWMNTTSHPPDNPGQTGLVHDGNLSTAWETDLYKGPDADEFGGYYTGEGLAIHLTGTHRLTKLVVDSPTRGWAASAYVAATAPASGSAVTAWGLPVSSASAIQGNVTFGLGGRTGQWVLLWLTNLGPAARAGVAEITLY